MYGFTPDNLASTIKSFPASLTNDNVQLVNVEFNKGIGKNGKPYQGVKFTFKREEQEIVEMLNELKLEPNGDYIKPRVLQDGTTQSVAEQLENFKKSYNTYLFHIATNYNCDLDKLTQIQASTFEDYANQYVAVVNETKSGTCYLKTCKNKAGYTCLPDYIPFLKKTELGSPSFTYSNKERDLVDKSQETGVKVPTELDSL